MPHEVVRAAGHDRARTLGWLALDWIEKLVVHGPGDVQGEPVRHGDEYSGFIVDCYALERRGGRVYDSAFFSRPKGADKSGLGARLALFEALGPCRFAGWAEGGEVYEDPFGLGYTYPYEPGEAMGRPVRVPYVRIMATEENQTGNVYDSIFYNLTDDDAPLAHVPGVDAGITRIILPGGGEITPSTASSASKDGGKETFVVFDESHLYNTPELRRMYATVTRNLRKRKKIAGTWFLETTTMFAAGEDSIAESTYKLAELMREGQESGKAKVRRGKLLFNHRFGICADLGDEKELTQAITDAYGEALGWNHLPSLVDEFYDPRADPADSCRYFLNAVSSAPDAWIVEHEWVARLDATKVVADRQAITLGFDGSRHRARGVTDATALIGCRVSDGHLFEIGVWEQPSGPAGESWRVPVAEVNAAVAGAFKRYNVVGFFADPAKWETQVADWEAKYGSKLKVRSSQQHPIEWWMTGGRSNMIVRALERFHNALLDGGLSHSGESAMTRHALNARRRPTRAGIQIAKDTPDSAKKIDAIVAAVLAHEARLAAVSKGLGQRRRRSTPQKVR